MKINLSKSQFRTAINYIMLTGLLSSVVYAGNGPSAHAEGMNAGSPAATPSSRQVILVPGTVAVDGPMRQAVIVALENAPDVSPKTIYFAITDLRLQGTWALASVIGLAQVHAAQAWSIDDGSWFGLVLLKQDRNGRWQGGTQGTLRFSSLIDEAPGAFLDDMAKQNLDLLRQLSSQQPSIQAASMYTFPWQIGTAMLYGSEGVHDNGFSNNVSGWKAVDMLSDGDTASGHAPNRLLAAAAGTISYKCTDSNNVAIHLGDFFYTHLVDNPGLMAGASFAQGAELGQMKVGSFGSTGSGCGWAKQTDGWFHIHWGFPNADLQVEAWTLSMSTQNWTDGPITASPGHGWIIARGSGACPAPSPSSPDDGYSSTAQTVTFSWSPLLTCAFNGYTLRIKNVSTMSTGGTTIVNTASSLTSLAVTIPSEWNNRDLYWGVKAANAPGASWSVRRFRIDAVPGDYGYCSDEGQRCAFSGTAQIYYGGSAHFIGPQTFSEGVDCNSTVLGDPISGTSNKCFMKGGRPEGSTWCADENGTCNFGLGNIATVYYGVNGKYNSQADAVSSIGCAVSTFGDPFVGLSKACYYVLTGSMPTTTATFVSDATQDGVILESAETSGQGGTINSIANNFKLGDDGLNRQYRAILSFDTSELPPTAVVTSATLSFRKAGLIGSNPFATLGNIVADIQSGAFGSDAALQIEDFKATAGMKAAFKVANVSVGGWYSKKLKSTSFGYINLIGVTQFRLRFATDDNNNSAADYLKFYSGNAAAANRPVLVITYYVP